MEQRTGALHKVDKRNECEFGFNLLVRTSLRVLVWLVTLGAMASMAFLMYRQNVTVAELRKQLQVQEENLGELDQLRAANKEAQQLKNQQSELERLRESHTELLRLRNETRQLREQLQEMETLRAANAQLLQAGLGASTLHSNQAALVRAARRRGAILGISARSASEPLPGGAPSPNASGAIVTSVEANSPVAQSGLKVGDLIYAVDGRVVANLGELQTEMLTKNPGETVVVDVLRGNAQLRFNITTRAWPQ